MRRQGDPSAIPTNKFWTLLNARVTGGQIVPRGGQSNLTGSAMTGSVTGIYNVDGQNRGTEGAVPTGFPASPDVVFTRDILTSVARDPWGILSTRTSGVTVYTLGVEADAIFGHGWYKGEVYVTYTYLIGSSRYFALGIYDKNGGIQQIWHFICPAGDRLTPPYAFRDKIFFCVESSTASNVVMYAYTPETGSVVVDNNINTAALGTFSHPAIKIIGFNEDLFTFSLRTTSWIRRRDSAGTWSVIALPGAGSVDHLSDMVVYKNNLYLLEGQPTAGSPTIEIYRWTVSTNLFDTTSRSLANAVHGTEGGIALGTFDGYMYFLWSDSTSASGCFLGRFDGTTWTDKHYTFTGSGRAANYGAIFEYAGNLYLFNNWTSEPIWYSNGTTTTSFTNITSGSTTFCATPVIF